MEPTELELKEQKAVLMERIYKEYKETPIETKNLTLKNIIKKINERGFNFDPFSIVKEIDSEADKQFKRLISDNVSGLTVGALASIKNEIIVWKNEEDERFDAFKKEYIGKELAKMDEVEKSVDEPKENNGIAEEVKEIQAKVTPIAHAKKKKK